MSTALRWGLHLAESGKLPDGLVRLGIRKIVAARSQDLITMGCEKVQEQHQQFVEECKRSPLALAPKESNQQHYEVPTEFFQYVLGRNMKYSSCFWNDSTSTLDDAENLALGIYCQRAELEDGMRILELGCGWGSLSLWMAQRYPKSQITTISHSATQKQYIDKVADERGLRNLQVITSDINEFTTDAKFDRVVSVEMFEHLRNHYELFRRISGWLNKDGKLFCHIFCHRDQASPYESHGPQDWMTDYFFTGGMMPSDRLFYCYQQHLQLVKHWRWSGTHYEKTSNAWLRNQDANKAAIMPIMERVYGKEHAAQWFQRWRIFFMACAECFGYSNGNEWWVAHYHFEKPRA